MRIADQISDSPFGNFITVLRLVQASSCQDHWTISYYFVEVLSDAATAPFHRRFDPFLWCLAHQNKIQSSDLSAILQVDSAILKPSFLRSFHPFFFFFCQVVSMLCFKLKVPENQDYSFVIDSKQALRILFISKYIPK